jgi:hypothetical protein
MHFIALILSTLLLLVGCSFFERVRPDGGLPGPKQFPNCDELTIEGIVLKRDDFELAGLTLGKYALGKLAYKRDPKLEQIYSQAARDRTVEECIYEAALRRGDIDPDDKRQRDYLKSLIHFLQLPHTAEEFIRTGLKIPFPFQQNLRILMRA